MKYRSRETIDAVQWRGDNLAELNELFPGITMRDDGKLYIGEMPIPADVGDYFVSEGYVIAAERFEARWSELS